MPAFPMCHVRHSGLTLDPDDILPAVLGTAVCLLTARASGSPGCGRKETGSGKRRFGGTGEVVFLVEISLLLLVEERGLGEIMQRFWPTLRHSGSCWPD